jgi:hypothetical protein
MTLPDERYRAVDRTRRLLLNLINPAHTPRIPKLIRDEARSCLRHFPTTFDMAIAADKAPEVFQEQMEPLYRMVKQYDMEKKDSK